MSIVAVGLFVLACGWNVYRLFLPTRAAAIRHEGHPQYFGASLAAGYVALLALFLHAGSLHFGPYKVGLDNLVKLAPQADKDDKADADRNIRTDPANQPPAQDRSGHVYIQSVQMEAGSRLQIPGHSLDTKAKKSTPPPAAPPKAEVKKTTTDQKPYDIVVAVGIWSALLSLLLPFFLNLPFKICKRLTILTGQKSFNDVEQTIDEASNRGISVAITLTSGKVYVGFPKEFDPNGPESDWISIWPLASGYRTKKGRLRLTTSYEEAYVHIGTWQDLTREDFKVTIPLNQITIVQAFNLQFYVKHFAEHAEDNNEDDFAAALEKASEPSGSSGQYLPLNEPIFSDEMLRLLKWLYHLSITATIVALPFSWLWSAIFLTLALSALGLASLQTSALFFMLRWLLRIHRSLFPRRAH